MAAPPIEPARDDPAAGHTAADRLRRWRVRHGRALLRVPAAAWEADATERAAALTYYAILSLFPMVLVVVCVVGSASSGAATHVLGALTEVVPSTAKPLVRAGFHAMTADRSGPLLAAVGAGSGLWSASSYLAVFRRGLHAVFGVRPPRPAWRSVPRTVLTAVTLLVLMVATVTGLLLTDRALRAVGALAGARDAAVAGWELARWPLIAVLVTAHVLVVLSCGPRGTRTPRAVLPGGVLAVVLWVAASGGFVLYLRHSAVTYSRIYGPLAGTVVFLIWLWLTNLALVLGAHYNAELHRRPPAPR